MRFNYFPTIDNLLDELKTTVTRTAAHLDSANAAKSSDVQFLKPSNSTTVVEESSSSPAGVSIPEDADLFKGAATIV